MTETKLNIAVLVKLAIDTRQSVGGTIMKADGTMNRAALPAIFNPNDKNALEVALQIKEANPQSTITVITMGADNAAVILKEAIYIGADNGVLVSDRLFAGADTLATSYVLSRALKKLSPDIIIAGRQTIDGDTGQVGPQVAQWLNIPQLTYVTKINSCSNGIISAERIFDNKVENLTCPLPALITVNSSAAKCRPINVKRYMTHKHNAVDKWSADDIEGDKSLYGLAGSPTLVSKVSEITVQQKDAKTVGNTDEELNGIVTEIINNRLIG